jgi:hypothetical protein
VRDVGVCLCACVRLHVCVCLCVLACPARVCCDWGFTLGPRPRATLATAQWPCAGYGSTAGCRPLLTLPFENERRSASDAAALRLRERRSPHVRPPTCIRTRAPQAFQRISMQRGATVGQQISRLPCSSIILFKCLDYNGGCVATAATMSARRGRRGAQPLPSRWQTMRPNAHRTSHAVCKANLVVTAHSPEGHKPTHSACTRALPSRARWAGQGNATGPPNQCELHAMIET